MEESTHTDLLVIRVLVGVPLDGHLAVRPLDLVIGGLPVGPPLWPSKLMSQTQPHKIPNPKICWYFGHVGLFQIGF